MSAGLTAASWKAAPAEARGDAGRDILGTAVPPAEPDLDFFWSQWFMHLEHFMLALHVQKH